jgi:hypothetical protein
MIKSSSTLSDEIQFIDADNDSANDPETSGRNGNKRFIMVTISIS